MQSFINCLIYSHCRQIIVEHCRPKLSENNLLTIEQFGFRTGHSTDLAAIQLLDHITIYKWT